MALRTVGVRLSAEVAGYVAGIKQANRATRDFAGELDKAARAGSLDAVADQAARVGTGMVALAGITVVSAARFDKAMSGVEAATHASAEQMELLREAAIQAGKDTAYSATEAAGAITELSKAGVSAADILGGGLDGALALAAAGELDVAEAAETAASAMTQFKLQGRDVTHIADLLAAGAGKAQGSVHDLSMALSQGGLVAAQMGLSVEDTTGTLAAFANAGLMGSDAGTSLKTALLMLANPSGEAADLMRELGIQTYDASGNFVGITALAGQLQTQLGTLTQEQRNAALATIFGADAIRAASILYERGADGVQEWIDKVDDAGYAAETARIKTDNLIGDIERLTGELETLAITSGSGATEGLRWLVQAAEALVAQLGGLHPAIGGTAVVMTALTGAALLGAAAWIKMRSTTAEVTAQLREVGPAGRRAARGLELTTKWGGRAAAAFAGLQVVGAVAAGFSDAAADIDRLVKSMEEFAKTGRSSGELARIYGEDLAQLSDDIKVLSNNSLADLEKAANIETLGGLVQTMRLIDDSMVNTLDRTKALDAALTQLVQGGNSEAAATQFGEIRRRAEEAGISAEQLAELFPGYTQAAKDAAAGSGDAADSIGGVGDAAAETAKDIADLNDAFDKLFDGAMSLDRATIAYKEGLIELREELQSGARSLDVNTVEGRKNRSAVLDQIDAIKDLRDSRHEHGMSLDEANRKYVKDIDGLRRSMLQAGFTKDEVDDLIQTYRDIPGKAATDVQVTGADGAMRVIRNYTDWLNAIPKTVYTRLIAESQTSRGGHREFRWGGIVEHAESGLLREAATWGPGQTLYAWREPATGGEAFIPRNGDMDRSRAIAEHVVSKWLGGQVSWGQQQPTAEVRPVIVESVTVQAWSDRFSLRQVEQELAWQGAI
ncbi:phage tail tape measure protein [Micromonospora sp. LOL_014]|uniref:phage tail tape measure protein n=1 Tax=Micromonospora sp. LOL_014 TaxID=3345415 RepID=UPI003A83A721